VEDLQGAASVRDEPPALLGAPLAHRGAGLPLRVPAQAVPRRHPALAARGAVALALRRRPRLLGALRPGDEVVTPRPARACRPGTAPRTASTTCRPRRA